MMSFMLLSFFATFDLLLAWLRNLIGFRCVFWSFSVLDGGDHHCLIKARAYAFPSDVLSILLAAGQTISLFMKVRGAASASGTRQDWLDPNQGSAERASAATDTNTISGSIVSIGVRNWVIDPMGDSRSYVSRDVSREPSYRNTIIIICLCPTYIFVPPCVLSSV